ncbi:MAG TPA: succinate dehydrogenase cytochrome b subunit [Tessaracoccus flavescens]|uniref:Succinate dehydrogenase cytochrome b subunit n=1 Tax=Tessaracoccus flavescens TaxID=399497 RepID=A0A921EMT4_9ACTN|nr:succinate dehydrogenase cytochrome b subunit [Tessaracoccus flavescens]
MSTATKRSSPARRAPRRPAITSFALKITMAVTGWLFAAFVGIHMYGNLKAYAGADAYNSYSFWLRNAFYPLLPHEGLLWIMRVVLAVALVAHVGASAILWARGRRFRGPHRRGSYFALGARSMPWTGILLLAFIVFHLLDLTLGIFGAATYQHATPTESFAFQNTVTSFQRPLAGGFYLLTMVALAAHLAHGLWTTANDVGVTAPRVRRVWKVVAYAVAIVIALGNATLPIAVWLGVLS